jgi:hypothetical protein
MHIINAYFFSRFSCFTETLFNALCNLTVGCWPNFFRFGTINAFTEEAGYF